MTVAPLVAETEAEFQQAVLDLATAFHWRCYHTHDSRHSAAGFPDLVLVRPPRLLVVELKAEKGRLSTAQGEWLSDLAACEGVKTRIWRPSDWDEIVRELAR